MATLAATALSTLARIKERLGIATSDTQLDAQIIHGINDVSDLINRLTNRTLVYGAGIVEYLSMSGEQRLLLKRRPVVSIASVYLGVDADGTDGSLDDTTNYQIEDAEAGIVFRAGGWPDGRLAYNEPVFSGRGMVGGWGNNRDSMLGYDPHPRAVLRNIKITYAAGYILPQYDATLHATYNPSTLAANLPASLERAVCNEVDRGLGLTMARGLKSQGDSVGHRVVYATEADLDPNTLTIIDTFIDPCTG